MLVRFECPLVEPRGVDVRVDLACEISRKARVGPRLLPAARVEVVQRQQLRGLLGLVFVPLLDDLRDPSVQLATPLVREPLVGRIADERVAEAECPGNVGIPLDELAEPIPRLRGRPDLGIVLEDVDDQRAREGDSQDRSPAQEGTIARRELVDAGRDERLDRLR